MIIQSINLFKKQLIIVLWIFLLCGTSSFLFLVPVIIIYYLSNDMFLDKDSFEKMFFLQFLRLVFVNI